MTALAPDIVTALCAAFVIALWLIDDYMTDRDSKELT